MATPRISQPVMPIGTGIISPVPTPIDGKVTEALAGLVQTLERNGMTSPCSARYDYAGGRIMVKIPLWHNGIPSREGQILTLSVNPDSRDGDIMDLNGSLGLREVGNPVLLQAETGIDVGYSTLEILRYLERRIRLLKEMRPGLVGQVLLRDIQRVIASESERMAGPLAEAQRPADTQSD